MVNPKDWLEYGQKFHGHKCPAMPMGLRVGAAAMNALGVDRAKDGQLLALVDLGEDHCATCFADGVQVITGCTFGKGNIKKTHKGKWTLTLIDKKNQKAVRVNPKGEMMAKNKQSPFIHDYRAKGIPASQVPEEIAEPLVQAVMTPADDAILDMTDVFHFEHKDPPHTFDGFICEECGEMVVESYGRVHGDKKLCQDCYVKAAGL